ncbi:MAG: ZIP family metal transporter [Bacteroidales bacterium]|nr:ZIP family metal transporter [Bacteroidales bacterium]
MSLAITYIIIVAGILLCGLPLLAKHSLPAKVVDLVSTFGAAFLFAVCFLHLVPHVFEPAGDKPLSFLRPGVWVLAGFLIQLLLETLTRGVEHGHNHAQCCAESEAHHHHHTHPIVGLMIGLSLHSFMEGMPLVSPSGQVQTGLLTGIVLHNIPITLMLATLFANNGYSVGKSYLLLLIFSLMTPLGSLVNHFMIAPAGNLEQPVTGVVVGILLHVSISILFNHDVGKKSKLKFLLIVLAFALAYFIPDAH